MGIHECREEFLVVGFLVKASSGAGVSRVTGYEISCHADFTQRLYIMWTRRLSSIPQQIKPPNLIYTHSNGVWRFAVQLCT